jgi:tetratricopeptide (TPR) repeat protein
LIAGAAAAVAIAGTIGSGGSSPGSSSTAQHVASAATHTHRAAPAKPVAKPKPKPKPKPTPNPVQTVTATPAAATTPPPTADTLEARGHQLMVDGDYSAAIAVLRQAVQAASPSSLTYAYALYDLGRSLRLAGDPKDAVTALYQRMQLPNQTGKVREQLQLALLALGQTTQSGGANAGPPGHRHDDHGNGPHGPGPRPGPGFPPGPGGDSQGD